MVDEVDARELAYFPDRYSGDTVVTEGRITFDGIEYWNNNYHARTYTLEPVEQRAEEEEVTLIERDTEDAPLAEAFLDGDIDDGLHATVEGEMTSVKDLRDGGYGGKYKRPKKTMVLDVDTVDLDSEMVYGV